MNATLVINSLSNLPLFGFDYRIYLLPLTHFGYLLGRIEQVEQMYEEVAAENGVDLLPKGKFEGTPDGSSIEFFIVVYQASNKLENVFV